MWALFKDKNDINEKNVIGFASFVVMTLFAIADLCTSLFADKSLNEYLIEKGHAVEYHGGKR